MPEANTSVDAPPRIFGLDRLRTWLYRRRWFLLTVVLPTLLATIYYELIASDVYISESRFVIKSPSQKQSQLSTLANLIQTTGLSSGQEQTDEVFDYIRSRDALGALEKSVGVRARYRDAGADWLSRFPGPFREPTFENLYKYYGHMVGAQLDHDTSTAVLTVKAFTPRDAYAINERLLELSEALVNRLNQRAQSKSIAEAERRVGDAQLRVTNARVALRGYRNAEGLLDPAKQATGVLEVSTGLVAEQAALRAQLQSIEEVAPRNPAIPALRDRIAAVGAQIASQDSKAVGSRSGIASKLTDYEKLLAEQEFASQMLTAADATLEQARTDAAKQQFYLERIVQPNMPDMSVLPHRIWQIFTVFATSLSLFFIGWMLIVGILEHAPED